jgi:hypothetical protein
MNDRSRLSAAPISAADHPSTTLLVDLPCGHRVDLAGHGVGPSIDDPWFRAAGVYLTEEEIDARHRTLAKWIAYDGRAVAESVTFMHGGTEDEPMLHAVGRFRGCAEAGSWVMYLEPMEAAS